MVDLTLSDSSCIDLTEDEPGEVFADNETDLVLKSSLEDVSSSLLGAASDNIGSGSSEEHADVACQDSQDDHIDMEVTLDSACLPSSAITKDQEGTVKFD